GRPRKRVMPRLPEVSVAHCSGAATSMKSGRDSTGSGFADACGLRTNCGLAIGDGGAWADAGPPSRTTARTAWLAATTSRGTLTAAGPRPRRAEARTEGDGEARPAPALPQRPAPRA